MSGLLVAAAGLASMGLSGCSSAGTESVGTRDQDLYGLGTIAAKWPNGVVPVCWQSAANHPELQAKIPGILVNSWSTAANITFTGFGACTGSGNQVIVRFADLNNPKEGPGFFGFTQGYGLGVDTITLISDDTSPGQAHFQYEVIHEFGHALGFAHEQERPDNWNGNQPIFCSQTDNNKQAITGGIYLTPAFDGLSIMNYCDPSGNLTTTLSVGDFAGARAAYGFATDPARARVDVTRGAASQWFRAISLHISDIDDLGWANIANANPGDEVWLDRTFDGGASWESAVAYARVPAGWSSWRTLMREVNTSRGLGQLRACGKAGDRPEISCSPWFGTDPARARTDAVRATATQWFRNISLHASTIDGLGWANIANGKPGDEVWLDRSFDGGATWESAIADAKIPAGWQSWRTVARFFNTNRGGGQLRACGKAGDRPEISCTSWNAL